MTRLATVLYEDSMQVNAGGNYPLHDFVMRVVHDAVSGDLVRLLKLVDKNPRKGIDRIVHDVKHATARIAGAGDLVILVDRDRVARHLGMSGNVPDEDVRAALIELSDAPSKLQVFFLYPSLEGLLRAIRACDPALLPDNLERAISRKKLIDRDLVLKAAAKAERRDLRGCVLGEQPGLAALAEHIVGLVSADSAR